MLAWLLMPGREVVPELMDDPSLGAAAHRRALAGLRRINRLSMSAAYLWRTLEARLPWDTGRPMTVLDVACGGGDVTVGLARRAQRCGRAVMFEGCDVSDEAVRTAQAAATQAGVGCRFFVHDALRDPLPAGYDAIICSLFLHHLSTEQVGGLLREMGRKTRLLIADDLVRCRHGHLAAWLGTRVLSRSPIVHTDGPRSVDAAFTPAELARLAEDAGLRRPRVERHYPARMQLVWRRP